TTAACLWIVSTIGLSVGAGLYVPAIATTSIAVLALWSLRRIDRRMATLKFRHIFITAESAGKETEIEETITGMKAKILNTDYEYDNAAGEVRFNITISIKGTINLRELFTRLVSINGVGKVAMKRG
ncbi:MAG TPA: hypothetical protein ENG86_10995, partial [Nitrospirae bacterium]|nr:hypothetical protein [Nitrospirota bacterium]